MNKKPIDIKDNNLSDKIIKQNRERELRSLQRNILKSTMSLEQQIEDLKERLNNANNLIISANEKIDALQDSNQNLITDNISKADKITALEKSIIKLAVQTTEASNPSKDTAEAENDKDNGTHSSDSESSDNDENESSSPFDGFKRNNKPPSSVASDSHLDQFVDLHADDVIDNDNEKSNVKLNLTNVKRTKMPDKTPIYTGNENLENWLWQLTHALRLSHTPTNEWVLVAGMYVQGHALTTYRAVTKVAKGEPEISWSNFVKTFWKAHTPKNNQLELRSRLQNLKQSGNIKNYVSQFRQLIGNISKMAEIDKIYLFLNGLNKQTKEYVGTTEPVTLESAINSAQLFAAYHSEDNAKTVMVSNAKVNKFIRSKGKTPPGQDYECFNCGKKGHLIRHCTIPKKYNAKVQHNNKNNRYNNVTKVNHNNNNCKPTNSIRRVNLVNSDDSNNTRSFVFSANANTNKKKHSAKIAVFNNNQIQKEHQLLKVDALVRGKQVSAILDCGATASVMSFDCFQEINKVSLGLNLNPTNVEVEVADGANVIPLGLTDFINIKFFNRVFKIQFYVLPIKSIDLLLGMDWFDLADVEINPKRRTITFNDGTKTYARRYNPSNDDPNDDNDDPRSRWIDRHQLHWCDLSQNERVARNNEIGRDAHFGLNEPFSNCFCNHCVCSITKIDEEIISPSFDTSDELDGDLGWDLVIPNSKLNVDFSPLLDSEISKIKTFINDLDKYFAQSWLDLGVCTVRKMRINLSTEVPVFNYPFRRSEMENIKMDEVVNKMLNAKIIRPSTSPYSCRAFFVPKKGGESRFVIDYKPLNAITISDPFPMWVVEDLINKLSGAKWFSLVDLKAGYWQIDMDPNSIQYTAFSTRSGHYEFLKMPFGLKNAVSEFSRIMNMVLGHLDFVIVYLDDITIFSSTLEQHFRHIKIVLDTLLKHGLKANKEKCSFFKKEIFLLGYVVSENRVAMNPDKVKAVENFKAPKSVKELQIILGLANYYNRFIKNYADYTVPLCRLLKREVDFVWTDECEIALSNIKKALTSFPTLRMPDFNKPFKLYTDASSYAIGGILAQESNGFEHVIYYISRILKPNERNYGVSEKEALAVVWSVKRLHHYLYGKKFLVITDHSALKWLMNIAEPTGRLMRWSLFLQCYDFEVLYRAGVVHQNADALSRIIENDHQIFMLNKHILVSTRSKTEITVLERIHEIYDDINLQHYVKNGSFISTMSVSEKERVKKYSKFYYYDNKTKKFFVKRELNSDHFLEIPSKINRKDLISKAHSMGHASTQPTVDRINNDGFTWPSIFSDVASFIDRCEACHKHGNHKLISSPAKALKIYGIFDRIGIDCVFGLPTTTDGYKGILVITEYLTKYPYAVPIRSKSAEEIASKLWIYFSLFGPAKQLLSDQGKEFLNNVMNRLLAFCGVEKRTTSAYSPHVNGLTEKFNSTLIRSLSKHCTENPKNWPDWIPFVLLAYRTRIHSTTGFTPNFLLFGREFNQFESYSSIDIDDELEISKRVIELERLKANTEIVKQTISDKQEQQKSSQNRSNNVDSEEIPIGSYVYVEGKPIKGKLEPKRNGPYIVYHHNKGGNYKLQTLDHKRVGSFPREKLLRVPDIEDDDKINFKVKRIIDCRAKDGHIEYLVEWENSDPDSWIKESHIDNIEALQQFNFEQNVAEEINVGKFKIHYFLAILCLILLLITPISGLIIKDKFNYCKITNNSLLLDSNKHSCLLNNYLNDKRTFSRFKILEKFESEVDGDAYMCRQIIRQYKARKSFWGEKELTLLSNHIDFHISATNCWDMIKYRTCGGMTNKLSCINNDCEFTQPPYELNYDYFSDKYYSIHHCYLSKINIKARNKNDKVFNLNCMAKDLYCLIDNSKIIVWNNEIIKKCLFKLVKELDFITDGTILYGYNHSMVLQIANKIDTCNSSIYSTREGFFVSNDSKLLIPKSEQNFNIIEHFTLSDIDSKYVQLFVLLQNKLAYKLCLFLNMLIDLQRYRLGYFKITDLQANEIIVHSDGYNLRIANCLPVEVIEWNNPIDNANCVAHVTFSFIANKI